MVKICMVVHKNYYLDTRVRRYTESLRSAGMSVDVICPIEDYYAVSEEQDRLKVYTIPVRHGHRSRISYLLEYGLAFIFYFIRLSFLYFKNHYQVVHVHNMPDFLVFSAIIPKIMGARVILDIHDPMPEVFLSKYKEQPHGVILRLIILQEKISCSFANAIITANSNFKANLTNRGIHASKITVINNYPDRDIFDRKVYKQKLQVKREEFILIYPGTIAPRYGLEVPIRSLPELILKIPEICLVIIGQNSKYKDKLMGIADQLGVSSYVQFKPVVPNKEIPSHMAQADIGIYPAQKDPHMDIATPTKVLEFATMGIPIISSRVKIVEEIFGNTSIMFFEPGDVKQFTQCVLRLYENPTLREELVQNADQAFVQKHSWENEFRIYLELLNQLLLGKVANKSRMS